MKTVSLHCCADDTKFSGNAGGYLHIYDIYVCAKCFDTTSTPGPWHGHVMMVVFYHDKFSYRAIIHYWFEFKLNP